MKKIVLLLLIGFSLLKTTAQDPEFLTVLFLTSYIESCTYWKIQWCV
jgi:hypothetical protein